MNGRSNTVPALMFGLGALALIAALVVTFVPFPTDGSSAPTSAFTAQKELDEVAFALGSSPGARYTGTLTTTGEEPGATPKSVEFDDLTVASTKNADGEITYRSTAAQYRQIGNYRYVNAPSQLWTDLFGGSAGAGRVDLGPTENKWTDLRYSGLPDLGYLLSPALLAGRIGNTERVEAPELGLQLPAPNAGLPDARYWPTSDPVITAVGDDKVRVGSMETTFDPTSKKVTHIKGEFVRGGYRVSIDTAVTPLQPEDLTTLFADEHELVDDLVSVPAPAVPLADNAVVARGTGSCTTAACEFALTANGTVAADVAADMRGVNGHVNFGLTVRFAVDNFRPGERGGTCTRVLTTPFGGQAQTKCSATDLPPGSRNVRTDTTIQYLPFIDLAASDLDDYIVSQEKSSTLPITMVRTGSKKPEAARYNDQEAGFPSSYGVKAGNYTFDGVGPEGNLFVAFAPGYAATHVIAGRLDPSWSGTALLTDQLRAQVTAAGDRPITYVTAEEELATALRRLALLEGIGLDKVTVFSAPVETS